MDLFFTFWLLLLSDSVRCASTCHSSPLAAWLLPQSIMDNDHPPRLPPMTGVKRQIGASNPWDAPPPPMSVANAVGSSMPAQIEHRPHKMPLDESAQFTLAAEQGARAQREVDNARGQGIFETYELGIAIVKSSKLYANQRRSNRQLPGGSDSTTAACYMLGGTPDSTLSPLVARVSPCDPREERCKAVERVLKDKTRGAICALNGENPREARADNLAAVRICEVVADILVAYAAKRLLDTLQDLYKSNAAKDATIRELREQLDAAKRRRIDIPDLRGLSAPSRCWCGGREPPQSTSSTGTPVTPVSSAQPQPNGTVLLAGGGNTSRDMARVVPADACYSYPSRDMPLPHPLSSRQLPPPPVLSQPPQSQQQLQERSLPSPVLLSNSSVPRSQNLPARSHAIYTSALTSTGQWQPPGHSTAT